MSAADSCRIEITRTRPWKPVDYRRNHPPTRPDEHADAPQLKVKVGIRPLFAFNPRSTHFKSQPRIHSIDVSPPGAFTTNSKSGFVVCARPTIHPVNTAATINATIRREAFM